MMRLTFCSATNQHKAYNNQQVHSVWHFVSYLCGYCLTMCEALKFIVCRILHEQVFLFFEISLTFTFQNQIYYEKNTADRCAPHRNPISCIL